jgi:hypothetical protein
MTTKEIMDAQKEGYRFTVWGSEGIAFYCAGIETMPDEDTVWTGQENPTGNLLMVMVGDDRKFPTDPDDVIAIGEMDYCAECGQIGCQHDGRDRA